MTVRIGKLSRTSPHPRLDGFQNLIVCSVNPNWGKLSPMKLGPFTVKEQIINQVYPGFQKISTTEQVATCQNFENFWQFSKIYGMDVDSNNNLTMTYFNRRAEGFAMVKAKRRVFPKKQNIATLGAYYNGKIYNYQDSRFFYCTWYEYLASHHGKYAELVNLVNSGQNVIILDYDAPDFNSHNISLTREYITNEYYNLSHPFGHGLVLCGMLLGIRPWVTHGTR